MNKLLLILFVNVFFIHLVNGQTLLQQIEIAYNKLDTISYIDKVVDSYRKEREALQIEYDNTTLELWGFDYENISSIQRHHLLDSIENERRKSIHYIMRPSIDEEVAQFRDKVKSSTPCFVLDLILIDKKTLEVDTGELAFDLVYLDKRKTPYFYVSMYNGRYDHDGKYISTFNSKVAKNAPLAFRKILRKDPQYVLFCDQLGALLYVLNDQIFIYRIIQNKEYKLDEYLKVRSAENSKRI